jgi:uncharacterized membrane protein
MMWYGSEWNWVGMYSMMFFSLGIVVLLVFIGARLFSGKSNVSKPMDVLRGRLASGEISSEEFDRISKMIQA